MELRTLGYFVAVVEAGSVSAAAEVVHVTQPAISRQLRQLEHEIDIELFDRSAGRLRLSAAGREFLPHARDVMAQAAAARAAARSLSAGRLERLTMAAPTTTLNDVIAPFLATLGPRDPLTTVIESDPHEAYSALRQGADLAIVTEQPHSTLASIAVAALPIWAYVPRDHRWSGQHEIDIGAVTAEPLVLLTPSFRPRQIVDTALRAAAATPDRVIECSNPQVAMALAAAGRGVAVVSDDPRFELCPLRIMGGDGPLTIELFAAWEPQHHAAPTLRTLADRVAAFCVQRYGPQVSPDRGAGAGPP